MQPNILILSLMLIFGLVMGGFIFIGWRNARKRELLQLRRKHEQPAYDTATGMLIPLTVIDCGNMHAANAASMGCETASKDGLHNSNSATTAGPTLHDVNRSSSSNNSSSNSASTD